MTGTDFNEISHLPIFPHLQTIQAKLQDHPILVVKADPGVGKTTGIPTFLADFYPSILVLQPRRLATRLTSLRVSEILKSKLGDLVGYQMRQDTKRSAKTRVLFITEGVFTKLLQQDPQLAKWQLVILDEFHERHLQSDVALANLIKIREQRPDLKIIIMSATLDLSKLEAFLGAPTLEIKASHFPVDTRYHPFSVHEPLSKAVLQAVQELRRETLRGNILVFLPGTREIMAAERALTTKVSEDCKIVPLTARLSQNFNAVVKEKDQTHIILTTNVAETSITIPGVTVVIDSGLAKVNRMSEKTGMPELITTKISQSSCIQRQGRAGRTQRGLCIRLFSESDYIQRPFHMVPEILRQDLSSIILELASLPGAEAFSWRNLPWLDPPSLKAWQSYEYLLQTLGVLENQGRISAFGKRVAILPLSVRLASLVIRELDAGRGEVALLAALILQEEPQFNQPPSHHARCDLTQLLEEFLQRNQNNNSRNCRDSPGDSSIIKSYEQLRHGQKLKAIEEISAVDEEKLRRGLFGVYADHVAKLRADRQQPIYYLCKGGEAKLDRFSTLHQEEWILALNFRHAAANAQEYSQINIASAVENSWLASDPFKLLREDKGDLYYGSNLYQKDHRKSAASLTITNDLMVLIKHFPDPEALSVYHRKIELMQIHNFDGAKRFPRFDSDEFKEIFVGILQDIIFKKQKMTLQELIYEQLDYDQQVTLKQLLPESLRLPDRRLVPIDYLADTPRVSAKLQWFFGMTEHPRILDGRLLLTVVLLAPNQRPAQITSDLPGFWRGSYQEVKKELKRRYPKHAWPDDPISYVRNLAQDKK